jgi:hypothetical protein
MLKLKIALCLLAISQEAFASESKGKMRCKISDQSIIQVDDGKTKKFGSYESDLEVGDSFYLEYKFEPESYQSSEALGHLMFKIKGRQERSLFDHEIYYRVDNDNWAVSLKNKRIWLHYENDSLSIDLGSELKFFQRADINPNSINLSFHSGEVSLILRRYYKSDWSGFIVSRSSTIRRSEIHYATFNCQHLTDSAWGEVITSIINELK